MSCCSALELAGAGVAGWVFLEERREDILGGKDGDAQLCSSGPVALILPQLLHSML